MNNSADWKLYVGSIASIPIVQQLLELSQLENNRPTICHNTADTIDRPILADTLPTPIITQGSTDSSPKSVPIDCPYLSFANAKNKV